MKVKKIFWFVFLASFALASCEEGAGGDSQTVKALKEALQIGTTKAVDIVKQPGGYLNSDIRINLPEDAQKTFQVINVLNSNPLTGMLLSALDIDPDLESTLTTLINGAAEDAAPKAVNVFADAITGMTISDGKNILFGADNAATQYLEDNTYTQLQSAFEPSISSSLETVKIGKYTPNSAWKALTDINNFIAGKVENNMLASNVLSSAGVAFNKMDPNLSNYVTGKALNGLFKKVAVQELNIRTNAAARTTSLLQDVFGQLDKH